ncbi:MAG: PQQ-like beta-propeller repeat protein [Chloroflexi bacterium]|nr:PQQ-like beta-propeller repeat protein [Chloroflexota bacterium]
MSFTSVFPSLPIFRLNPRFLNSPADNFRRIRRRLAPGWRLSLLSAMVALTLVSCTPNLGGDNVGWTPVTVAFSETPGDPTLIYTAAQMDSDLGELGQKTGLDLGDDERQVKLAALEDFGSGTPRVVWTFPPLGSGDGLQGVFGPPAVSQELGLIFLGAVDGTLYALNLETGEEGGGWKRAIRNDATQDPQPIIGAPVLAEVFGGDAGQTAILLVVSEDGHLYAFNAATGNELAWSPFRTGDRIWSTPRVQNGIAYFGSQDHYVYAVDLRDGKELWKYETGGAVVGNPLLFRGDVIIGSFDKKLYALDADDGELEWFFESGNWFWAGAVTDGENIFAPSMDGFVYALDTNAPSVGEAKQYLWRHNMGSPVVSTPALVPLGLVVAAADGRVRVLSTSPSNLADGEVITSWEADEDESIKAPLVSGAPGSQGLDEAGTGLNVLQRHFVFMGSDNGVVRRVTVSEGQDIGTIWCFEGSLQRQCN